jgi:hypothetical protein
MNKVKKQSIIAIIFVSFALENIPFMFLMQYMEEDKSGPIVVTRQEIHDENDIESKFISQAERDKNKEQFCELFRKKSLYISQEVTFVKTNINLEGKDRDFIMPLH